MQMSDFEKIVDDINYSINFGISIDQHKLKLFYENYGRFKEHLTPKYASLCLNILNFK